MSERRRSNDVADEVADMFKKEQEEKEKVEARVEKEEEQAYKVRQAAKGAVELAALEMKEAVDTAHKAAMSLENSDLLAEVLDHLGKAQVAMDRLVTQLNSEPY